MATTSADIAGLTCWKDIANYLGKGVRTVQRWEQEFGLPVRRPNGISHKSPVAASPQELDAWLKLRWSIRSEDPLVEPPVAASDEHPPQLRDGMLQQVQDNVRQSSELQASLRLARQQHRMLVHELTASISSLSQTCRLMASARKRNPDS